MIIRIEKLIINFVPWRLSIYARSECRRIAHVTNYDKQLKARARKRERERKRKKYIGVEMKLSGN
jgi:hypothetical protein